MERSCAATRPRSGLLGMQAKPSTCIGRCTSRSRRARVRLRPRSSARSRAQLRSSRRSFAPPPVRTCPCCAASRRSASGQIVGVVGIAKGSFGDSRLRTRIGTQPRSLCFDVRFSSRCDRRDRCKRPHHARERANGMLSQYRTEELIGMPIEMLATAQDALEHAGTRRRALRRSSAPARCCAADAQRKVGHGARRHGADACRRARSKARTSIARDVSRERELEFRERVQRERLRSLAHLASENAASVERQINELL